MKEVYAINLAFYTQNTQFADILDISDSNDTLIFGSCGGNNSQFYQLMIYIIHPLGTPMMIVITIFYGPMGK